LAAEVEGVEARLAALGLELPPPAVLPTGARLSYRRFVRHRGLAYISGHGPVRDGETAPLGRVGVDLDVDEAIEAARLTALAMFRTIKDNLGSLDAVETWLEVTGYVRATPDFVQQSLVINGFTDLVRDLWGEDRLAARAAVGVADLPFGMPVEVSAVVALRDG
jgi:enamine deaminase RidA (YjgF/YER057c/UK114 family)